eukprot:s1982_g7.t1
MRSWQQALVLSKESRSGSVFFSSFCMFVLPSPDSSASAQVHSELTLLVFASCPKHLAFFHRHFQFPRFLHQNIIPKPNLDTTQL